MVFSLLKSPSTLLVRVNFVRAFSQCEALRQQSKQGVSNSGLYNLRKSTGYPLNKCRDALEKNNGDIAEATKWLNEQAQKEGWTKAEKLKNRLTSQGALALFLDKTQRKATIVEVAEAVNCETDFVARNEKFIELSTNVAKSVLRNVQPSSSKHLISKEELNKVNYLEEASKTIGDHMALSIGSLGENMSVRRAVVFNLPEGQTLSWYIHGSQSQPINGCHVGKYGSLVSVSMKQRNENYKPFDIGRQIAQHIVGMKSKSIGEIPADVDPAQPVKVDENESRLLHQEFLMKPEIRVIDFLNQNHATINDFVRFECGEVLENE